MLTVKLSECCYKCNNGDLKLSSNDFYDCKSKRVDWTVTCEKMDVCKFVEAENEEDFK